MNLAATVAGDHATDSANLPSLAPRLAVDLDPRAGRAPEGPSVVFLVDGLGYRALGHWVAGGSTRSARWAAMARPITTVFPSTTTTALASLSTATPPGRHGLVGYRQYLPRFGVVADLLKMSPLGATTRDLLIGPTWRPSDISGAPTLFRRGVPAEVVTRGLFEGTGVTRLLYDGARLSGYATGTDLAHTLVDALTRPDPAPVVYVYWDELDTVQHLRGPQPPLIDLELERVAHLMEYVVPRVPPSRRDRTTVFVTGDHGQVPATLDARIPIERHANVVAEMSRPLAGDRRSGLFAARPGRTEALRRALEGILPAGSRILPIDEAVDGEVYGPPPFHPELADRLGDLLVLVPSPAGLTYLPPGAASPARHLDGAHGGLEPDELVVPLIAGPLAAFGAAEAPGGRKKP